MGKIALRTAESILKRGSIDAIHKMVTTGAYSKEVNPGMISHQLITRPWHTWGTEPKWTGERYAYPHEMNKPKHNEIFRHLLKNHTPQELDHAYGNIASHSDTETRSMILKHHMPFMDGRDHVLLAREAYFDHDDHQVQAVLSHPHLKGWAGNDIKNGIANYWNR